MCLLVVITSMGGAAGHRIRRSCRKRVTSSDGLPLAIFPSRPMIDHRFRLACCLLHVFHQDSSSFFCHCQCHCPGPQGMDEYAILDDEVANVQQGSGMALSQELDRIASRKMVHDQTHSLTSACAQIMARSFTMKEQNG